MNPHAFSRKFVTDESRRDDARLPSLTQDVPSQGTGVPLPHSDANRSDSNVTPPKVIPQSPQHDPTRSDRDYCVAVVDILAVDDNAHVDLSTPLIGDFRLHRNTLDELPLRPG